MQTILRVDAGQSHLEAVELGSGSPPACRKWVDSIFDSPPETRSPSSGATTAAAAGRSGPTGSARRSFQSQGGEEDPQANAIALRVDASSRATGSVSCTLGDYCEAAWLDRNPRDRVIRRDVAAEPIGHIADRTIAGFYTQADQFTADLRTATALSDLLIEEVQAADVLLLTLPMYNFSLPSALKAWIDHVVRVGHTFSYDGTGFTGLVTGRRAYVVCAFGAGGYLDGGPFTAADFVQPYLRFILNFLGIQDVRFFAVEGTVGDAATLAASTEWVKREIAAAVAAASTEELAAA